MKRVFGVLLAGAVVGFSIFGVLAYRAVKVDPADPLEAGRRIDDVRSTVAGDPLLTLDAAGNVIRRALPPPVAPQRPVRLRILAYQSNEKRLVSADMPFWFFKLKGPAAQYVVGGTGLDLERLQITASDLERYGQAVVIDHVRGDGSRLLVWTE